MNGTVDSLTTWDPDGDGPLGVQLVAGGTFTLAGGVPATCIGRWDGTTWHPFGTGLNGEVYALTTWDPNGDGPTPPQLVAGGYFTLADSLTVNHVALWDGVAWHALGSGMNNTVYSLTTWDPDGDGPLPAELIAGGRFFTAGDVPANSIARWNGLSWQPFGAGIQGGYDTSAPAVYAMTNWDIDGAGPLAPKLVAGGEFTNAGTLPAGRLAMWSRLHGDLNGNNAVEIGDLAVLLSHFGARESTRYLDGDLDGDGNVSIGDLTVLLSAFGRVCP